MTDACTVKKRTISATRSLAPAGRWVVELRLPGEVGWQILATQPSGGQSRSKRQPRLWRYERAHMLAGAIQLGFPGTAARVALPPNPGETVRLFLAPPGVMSGEMGAILGMPKRRRMRP